MRDHDGKVLEMILNSHRRIRILHPLKPPRTAEDFSKLAEKNWLKKTKGGKRSRVSPATQLEDIPKEGNENGENTDQLPIIYARTENIILDPGQITVEIKVLLASILRKKIFFEIIFFFLAKQNIFWPNPQLK